MKIFFKLAKIVLIFVILLFQAEEFSVLKYLANHDWTWTDFTILALIFGWRVLCE